MGQELTRAFTPEEEQDIICTAAYHRNDEDLGIAHTNTGISLHATERVFAKYVPKADLGRLRNLPTEIMHLICLHMDLRALMRFRHVSRRTYQLIVGLREWDMVYNHGGGLLHVLYSTKLASNFTIADIYRTLTSSDCVCCGRVGGLVFLPRIERSCLNCIGDPIFDVWHISPPAVDLGPTNPKMYCLPGYYTKRTYIYRSGDSGQLERGRNWIVANTAGQNMNEVLNKPWCITREPMRGKAFASIRYLDQKASKSQEALYCGGCSEMYLDWSRSGRHHRFDIRRVVSESCKKNMMYLRDSFLAHFRTCEVAQIRWMNEVKERDKIIRDAKRRVGKHEQLAG